MALLDPTLKRKIYSWVKTEATARTEILTLFHRRVERLDMK